VSRLALVGFAALLLFPGLARMGAMDSTDARYLAIAREMARTGEWLVPQLGGAPHLDKPPLAYWASIAGERVLGAGEFGGRAAQPLALLATALAVAAAAQHLAGAAWALVAGLVLMTSALAFGLSRVAHTDLLQLAFVTPALALLHHAWTRGAALSLALAGALLGVSMGAKGPIGLLVVASVGGGAALLSRAPARLPRAGVALGIALFAAIGLPWYVLVAERAPGVIEWYAGQIGARVTGDGVGHVKDVTYLARAWALGLLPWTPVVLLSLWRLRPRGGRGRADPGDAFVVSWALAPVLVFSLFETKLASYVAPALPGAALAVARAGARGLLADRAARAAIAISFATAALVALLAGGAFLAETQLGRDAIPRFESRAPTLVGAALLAIGALGCASLFRVAALDARRALLVTGCAAGALLAGLYHAAAGDLPTWREEGRLAASVPGARLVAFSFQPSLFYYAEPEATVFVAGVRGLVEPFVDPAAAQRLTLSRADALAMLREDAPTFAFVDAWQAADLADLAATRTLRRARKYALVANPAALRALSETGAAR
jgi:4-amino-4-deoxy-L-arabinose transferase-like glycosyltransferase